eukprot:3795723-Pyramimonas_sp.AAC.1
MGKKNHINKLATILWLDVLFFALFGPPGPHIDTKRFSLSCFWPPDPHPFHLCPLSSSSSLLPPSPHPPLSDPPPPPSASSPPPCSSVLLPISRVYLQVYPGHSRPSFPALPRRMPKTRSSGAFGPKPLGPHLRRLGSFAPPSGPRKPGVRRACPTGARRAAISAVPVGRRGGLPLRARP